MDKEDWKLLIASMLCLIIALISGIIASTSETNYYNKADSLGLAVIVDSHDLTIDDLKSRNGKLIIERVIGIVDDAETGAGHVINNADYYISYESVDSIANGNVICTYLVYNPDTNYEDDVLVRCDYIIE